MPRPSSACLLELTRFGCSVAEICFPSDDDDDDDDDADADGYDLFVPDRSTHCTC